MILFLYNYTYVYALCMKMAFLVEYLIMISLFVSITSVASASPNITAELITSLFERIQRLEVRMAESEEANQVSAVPRCCPNGWLYFNNSCYNFYRDVRCSYIDAKAYCKTFDSNVLQIETEAESLFIKNFLRGQKDNHYWIGLTDLNIESVWRWDVLGNAPSFTDWYPGEPNSVGHEDCAILSHRHNYEWLDVPCNGVRSTACEKTLN